MTCLQEPASVEITSFSPRVNLTETSEMPERNVFNPRFRDYFVGLLVTFRFFYIYLFSSVLPSLFHTGNKGIYILLDFLLPLIPFWGYLLYSAAAYIAFNPPASHVRWPAFCISCAQLLICADLVFNIRTFFVPQTFSFWTAFLIIIGPPVACLIVMAPVLAQMGGDRSPVDPGVEQIE